ncbi:hypothetical protein HDU97_009979 [Phlyctochytrium planicorne]|nr:hypothetical protein HDU97_009979 [Phlyctochytrium planicorne]
MQRPKRMTSTAITIHPQRRRMPSSPLITLAVSFVMLTSVGKAELVCNQATIIDDAPMYDIVGFDLHQSMWPNVTTSCKCAAVCEEDPACVFFSYDTITDSCYTKRPRQESQNMSFFKNGNEYIKVVGSISSDNSNRPIDNSIMKGSEQECKDWCTETPKCRFATLEVKPLNIRQCKLFEGNDNYSVIGVKTGPSGSLPSDPEIISIPVPEDPTSSAAVPSASSSRDTTISQTRSQSPLSTAPGSQPPVIVVTTVIDSNKTLSSSTDSSPSGNTDGGYTAGLGLGLGIAAAVLAIIAGVVLYVLLRKKSNKAEYVPSVLPRHSPPSPSLQRLVSLSPPPQMSQESRINLPQNVGMTSSSSRIGTEPITTPEAVMARPSLPNILHREKEPSKIDLTGPSRTLRSKASDAGSLFGGTTIYRSPSSPEPPENLRKAKSLDTFQASAKNAFKKENQDALPKTKSMRARQPEKVEMDAGSGSSGVPSYQNPPRNLRNPEMLSWSAQEVSESLTTAGVSINHVDILRDHNINGYSLLLLNESRLQEMGVEPQSARLLVLTAVNILRGYETIQQEAPPQYS